MKSKKIVVVGAGIAGLGTAYSLQKRGFDVQVVEAGCVAGGRAKTLVRKKTGDRCDTGTQFYHSNFPRALKLIDEVGLSSAMSKIKGPLRFFDDRFKSGSFLLNHGTPYIAALGPMGNLRVFGFVLHRMLRHRFKTYALEDQPLLDQIRALDVTSSPSVRYVMEVLSKIGNVALYEDISLYQILRLLRIDFMTDYINLEGGVASLHHALADRLDVRLETPVEHLVVERGTAVGVAIKDSTEVIKADHVVMAVPPPRAARIIPEEWREEREFLNGVKIPTFVLPSFFLDRPLEKEVWGYFMPPEHDGVCAMVTDASQKNPAMVPSGNAILQPWSAYPVNTSLVTQSDEDIIETCRKEMEEFFPGFSDWIEEVHVTRHAEGIPLYPVGHASKALAFLENVEKRPGVSFCGDFLASCFMESALWTGDRAADRIRS